MAPPVVAAPLLLLPHATLTPREQRHTHTVKELTCTHTCTREAEGFAEALFPDTQRKGYIVFVPALSPTLASMTATT